MSEPTSVVTDEQLKKLSLRAIVAYAARCARRVLPLYPRKANYFWGKKKDIRSLDAAVYAAELFAANDLRLPVDVLDMRLQSERRRGRRDSAMNLAAARAVAASNAAEAIAKKMASSKNLPVIAIASAASGAAFTAAKAAVSQSSPNVDPNDVITQARVVDCSASVAAIAAGVFAEERAAKIRDYEELLSQMVYSERFPKLGDYVEITGPLWPDGEPNWR